MTLDDFSEGERLDAIKAHLAGPATSPLFLLDACRWLVGRVGHLNEVCSMAVGQIDELENDNQPNLKLLLMELGNSLVTEHGWEPAAGKWWDRVPSGEHTGLIAALTEQINAKPAMRESLTDLGVEWPMPVGEVI